MVNSTNIFIVSANPALSSQEIDWVFDAAQSIHYPQGYAAMRGRVAIACRKSGAPHVSV